MLLLLQTPATRVVEAPRLLHAISAATAAVTCALHLRVPNQSDNTETSDSSLLWVSQRSSSKAFPPLPLRSSSSSGPTRTCRVGCHVDKLGIVESLRIQCERSLILNHILMDNLPFYYRRSCATVKRTLIQAPISKTGLVLELRNGLRFFSLASSHSKCFWIFFMKAQKWKAEFFFVMALLLPNLFWFFGLIRYMLWFSSCSVSLIRVAILRCGAKNFCLSWEDNKQPCNSGGSLPQNSCSLQAVKILAC
jgi:hypothetical protein